MKRLYGVYDEKRKLRYIGASSREEPSGVVSDIHAHLRGVAEEVARRNKKPNRREILFTQLIERDALTVQFLSKPRKDWMAVRKILISEGRSRGLNLANESNGGPGSSGVPVSPGSIKRALMSRARITDEDAYTMHSMWRLKNLHQREIATHFNLTEKGVQKILNGSRRTRVYVQWLKDHRAPDVSTA